MLCPPDGHLAGIYARVDGERGVHKAPANETVRGALGLERLVTDTQQDPLNTNGVNVLRAFPGQARPVVWGARTTVRTDITDWRYVNVRRLLCYIEESIQEGLRWAVFEPNDIALWQKLTRTASAFLTGVWRDGALFGATAAEAFSVRCDAALNPPEARALGRLVLEIKVAPVRPAEFIVVRISLWDGGSEASE
jgi:phage tail sheath protein FI